MYVNPLVSLDEYSVKIFNSEISCSSIFKMRGILEFLTVVAVVACTTATKHIVKRSPGCDPYSYCNGINFPHDVMLDARKIKCDNAPTPRDHCCLPQAKHLVCYNIKVDGQDLNYDETNNAVSTDFTGLCHAMARARNRKVGKHSSAVVENGGGTLAWRYGEWAIVVQPGSKHVEHLACEILH